MVNAHNNRMAKYIQCILQANNLLSTKLKPKYCQLESASGYNSLIGERIEMQLRLSLWPSDGILPSMHWIMVSHLRNEWGQEARQQGNYTKTGCKANEDLNESVRLGKRMELVTQKTPNGLGNGSKDAKELSRDGVGVVKNA